MLGPVSVMVVALSTLVMLTSWTAASQAERSTTPEILWRFEAGG